MGDFRTADQFWGSGGPRAEEWARGVEASSSYQVALGHEPVGVELYHSPVSSPAAYTETAQRAWRNFG